ncbi:hypothetical protein B0H14DRAFT_2648548 [Mycena olivaceomarginata]|nr:hypothetical protein B0H14DRAFT_2648548 [Mycena olivaceomarginata]
MPPMNLTNTVADPEGLILAQMDRERDPVESENPNEQISRRRARDESTRLTRGGTRVSTRREEEDRRVEEDDRGARLGVGAEVATHRSTRYGNLLTVRDGDEDADINIRLLLGLNQSHATPPVPSTAFFHVPLPATSLLHGDKRRLRATFNCSWLPAHRLQRLPLDQLHIPTVPHPQLPFWTMIKRYLIWVEAHGWPDGVLLEPPAQMLAGGSGAAQMLWKRLDSGTCYWEKLPDAEYHALREKYQGFKRVKVEKGEVQEHHDGPRSSTLGKRRRYLPRNEVDHSTSHESTVPKGRGGTARQPAKRCRASPEAPPSRKLNSALSDQPQAISVTRVSTRNSPGGIKIKIPRRSPKRLSQIHGASSDCDSDESG